MRSLAFAGRGSGRTTLLINEIMRDMECHDKTVYVVAGNYGTATLIKRSVREMNGDYKRVIPVTIHDMKYLKGVDSRNIYFEHTAYEMANSKQLMQIYEIEDIKANIIWGVP
jgi:hypothetical protein